MIILFLAEAVLFCFFGCQCFIVHGCCRERKKKEPSPPEMLERMPTFLVILVCSLDII